jgi:chitin synthase
MSDNSAPQIPKLSDPFADRPRQTHFVEPERPIHASAHPSPYESTTTLPHHDFGGQDTYANDDYIEKIPLTQGQDYPGATGFYPPGSVTFTVC